MNKILKKCKQIAQKKGFNWIIAVSVGVILPVGVWAVAQIPTPIASTVIYCQTAESCSNLSSAPSPEAYFGAYAPVESQQTTYTGSLKIGDDLTVTDGASIGGTLAVTGDTTLSGALALTGDLTSSYLSHLANDTIVSTTTTQKVCTITNDSSDVRILDSLGAKLGTNNAGAGIRMTVSTSFDSASAATGTAGTTLLQDNSWTLSAASSTASASSTAGFSEVFTTNGTMRQWDPGESLIYLVATPTTTLTGSCYALYY